MYIIMECARREFSFWLSNGLHNGVTKNFLQFHFPIFCSKACYELNRLMSFPIVSKNTCYLGCRDRYQKFYAHDKLFALKVCPTVLQGKLQKRFHTNVSCKKLASLQLRNAWNDVLRCAKEIYLCFIPLKLRIHSPAHRLNRGAF